MSFVSRKIAYGKSLIEFTVVRRDRKTLEIAVEPDMSVVVAAPRDATIEAIEKKVRKRASWVRRKQRYFFQYLPRTPDRQYVSGETHLYLGRQYRLRVIRGSERGVKLLRGTIIVVNPKGNCPATTRDLVNEWYQSHALRKFRERLEVCKSLFPKPDEFAPSAIVIRDMKMRWGSMSPTHRLQLSSRLIQAPVDAIDYVITHELCHIAVPHHGAAFFELLGRVMPDWQQRKLRLERILA